MEEEGKEGPIKCIFLCKFHPEIGPIIVCQYPENYISKEVFETIHNYLIPKPQIKKRTITISVFGLKISGYPNEIENTKYLRNAFIFNLCFVCDSKSRSIHYEPVVKKLSEYLENLEFENGYLSNEASNETLPKILAQIMEELNDKGKCTVKISLQNQPVIERRTSCRLDKKPEIDFGKTHGGKPERRYNIHTDRIPSKQVKKCGNDNRERLDLNLLGEVLPYVSVLNLKQAIGIRPHPPPVQDHDVPILICSKSEAKEANHQWDLTTQQILDYMDGMSHIAKIAAKADVHKNLVKDCVQNLLYYRIVRILPIFQYSNMYTTISGLHKLFTEKECQEDCLPSITFNTNTLRLPSLSTVLQLYSSLTYGVSVRDLCLRSKPRELNIDERKLIQYGLLHGFIRRIHQYPVLMTLKSTEDSHSESIGSFFSMCNGQYSMDEICCKFRMTYHEVNQRLEEMYPNVVMIVK